MKYLPLALAGWCVALGALIVPYVDQTTFALLGGTFIGLLVAIPATLLVILIALRLRADGQRNQPPATHTTRIIERIVVVVPTGATRHDQCRAIQQLQPGITIKRAEQMLLEGKVTVVQR